MSFRDRRNIQTLKGEGEMNIKTVNDMYKLGIGEVMSFAYGDMIRVPGGWIWQSSTSSCFVPYSREYEGYIDSEEVEK